MNKLLLFLATTAFIFTALASSGPSLLQAQEEYQSAKSTYDNSQDNLKQAKSDLATAQNNLIQARKNLLLAESQVVIKKKNLADAKHNVVVTGNQFTAATTTINKVWKSNNPN